MALDKSFKVNSRRENCRNQSQPNVKKFGIDDINQHFNDSINKIEMLSDMYSNTNNEALLRAQVVFLESAFDFFMHEITKLCLCEMFENSRNKTQRYNKLSINLEQMHKLIDNYDKNDLFVDYINSNYETVSMLSYESVSNQCKLLGLDFGKTAKECFPNKIREKSIEDLKSFFNNLYSMRNCIAHQSSRSHIDATIQDITVEFVNNSFDTLKNIVKNIIEQIEKVE